MDFVPHPYQTRLHDFVLDEPYCALFARPGLGKTVVALTALADLYESLMVNKTLVVAPKRVAQLVWPDELRKWNHLHGRLTWVVIEGVAKRRLELVKGQENIHIINYELLWWLTEHIPAKKWPYDMLILDESHKVKNRRTRAFKAARRARVKAKRAVELTGTPATTGRMDLWAQLYLLDLGKRLGPTLTGYRQRHFVEIPNARRYDLLPGAGAKIDDAIADICVSLRAEDYLKLPDRLDIEVKVRLPEKARAQYQEMEKEFLIEFDAGAVSASTTAVQSAKLRQVANGALYYEEGAKWHDLHDEKLDALADIIEQTDGPVLVGYQFRFDLARLKARFPGAEAIGKDPTVVARWNNREIPLLLAQPASAGLGLNLQRGGSTIVWYGVSWSLEQYIQFNARLERQGQTEHVFVHHILAEDTVDERVMDVLAGRATEQDALMAAVELMRRRA